MMLYESNTSEVIKPSCVDCSDSTEAFLCLYYDEDIFLNLVSIYLSDSSFDNR